MKRDMDLVRAILIEIEKFGTVQQYTLDIEGYEEQNVAYHVMLLKEASFILAAVAETSDRIIAYPIRLTWQGHEFLDNARDETRWNEAKKIAGQKGGSMAFDVIKGVLVQLALQTVGLR
jgi:hypothetical protein